MAITNISTPSVLSNLVSEPFLFEFSMTPVETATEIRRFGYQLCDDSDNPISAKELISPVDGKPFLLDFQDDICSLVHTAVPECNNAIEEQPEMEASVRLKVFEHVFNKDTCVITIENEQSLGDYVVLNAANQYWGGQILGSGGWQWLNPMAGQIDMCRSRCQLIYVWSPAPNAVQVDITAMSVSGVEHTLTRNNTSRVNAFLIDPYELADLMTATEEATAEENLPRIKYITVAVDDTELVKFKLVDCCCIHRIAWQHSGGGYSFMNFDCERILSIQGKGSEVYRWQDKRFAYSPTLRKTRTEEGASIAGRLSYKKIAFTTYFEYTDERDLRYLEDFLSSGSYFYEFVQFTGTFDNSTPQYDLVKFIPDYGNIKYFEEDRILELSFGGKIAMPHNMPNYAI